MTVEAAKTACSAPSLHTEDNWKSERQTLVRYRCRRRRHRIGSAHHRKRGLIKGGITGPFDDRRRQNVSCSVECEANNDLRALLNPIGWITLVPIEMSEQFILPSRPQPLRGHARSIDRRNRTRSLRAGFRTGNSRGLDRHGCWRGLGFNGGWFGIIQLRLMAIVSRDHAVCLIGLVRYILRQFGFFFLDLLLRQFRRGHRSFHVWPRGQVAWLCTRRGDFDANFDGRRADRIIRINGLKMGDSERRTTKMKRERRQRSEYPQAARGWSRKPNARRLAVLR